MKSYLEYHEGKNRKLWQIEVDGDTRTVIQGKVGAEKVPTPKTKTFKSAEAAAKNHDAEVAKKRNAGYFDPTSLASVVEAHAANLDVPSEQDVAEHREECPYLSDDYIEVYRTGALVGSLNEFGKPHASYDGAYGDLMTLCPAYGAEDHELDDYFYIVGELADGSALVHINQGKWAGRITVIEHGPGDEHAEHVVEGDPDATIQAWLDAELMEPLQETSFYAFVLDRLLHHKGGAVELLRAREKALAVVEAKIEGDPAAIESLDLSESGLRALPDSIASCVNLRAINLYKNELRGVPKVLGSLRRLESVDLRYNQIEMGSVPEWLAELPVRTLDLTINRGEVFPEPVTSMRSLETLRLPGVDRIPASVANLHNLRHFETGGVTGAIEADGITRCSELRSLKLGRIGVPLPADIGSLIHLETLVCDTLAKDAPELPESLGSLAALVELSAGAARLPNNLGGLESLESLKVTGHEGGLPSSLSDLGSLRRLDLHYCRTKTLPEDIGRLSKLEWLKLESAYVEELPESFRELRSLTWLNLATAGEGIRIGDRLAELAELEHLALYYGALKTIEGSLAGLRSLQKLSIYRSPGPEDDWQTDLAFVHDLPALAQLGICYELKDHFKAALPNVEVT